MVSFLWFSYFQVFNGFKKIKHFPRGGNGKILYRLGSYPIGHSTKIISFFLNTKINYQYFLFFDKKI